METSLRAGLGNAAIASVLAVLVGCLGCLLRRRPALRHGLWLLVLLKLVTPPAWVVPVAWLPAATEAEPGRVPPPIEPIGEWTLEDIDLIEAGAFERAEVVELPPIARGPLASRPALAWGTIAGFAWLAGSLLIFGAAGVRLARFRRLLRLGRRAPAGVIAQVEALAGRLGLRRMPEVWWMPGAVSPMLWAAGGRPLLIVPAGLWKRLDDRQRVTLLVHELAHLKRRDHWVRGLELVATGLYWWHPAAWWARRELREAEEQCCDAWVVWAFPDAARTYAETLLEAVDFLSRSAPAVPMLASGLGQAQHLKRRLTMIMRGTTHRALNRTGALAVLGLSALLLPLSPTWAQKADERGAESEVVLPKGAEDARNPDPKDATRRTSETPDRSKLLERLQKLEEEAIASQKALAREHQRMLNSAQAAKEPRNGPEQSTEKSVEIAEDGLPKDLSARRDFIQNTIKAQNEVLLVRQARRDFEKIEELKEEERVARAAHEQALARLHAAEARLKKMAQIAGGPFKVVAPEEVVITAEDGKTIIVRSRKGEGRGDGTIGVIGPGEITIRKDAKADSKGPGETELRAKEFRWHLKPGAARVPGAADPERRIDELEKRLDELIGVVKSLKAERDGKDRPQALPRPRKPGQPDVHPPLEPIPGRKPEKPEGDENKEAGGLLPPLSR